jgi:hypothetical protein
MKVWVVYIPAHKGLKNVALVEVQAVMTITKQEQSVLICPDKCSVLNNSTPRLDRHLLETAIAGRDLAPDNSSRVSRSQAKKQANQNHLGDFRRDSLYLRAIKHFLSPTLKTSRLRSSLHRSRLST